MKLIHFWSNNTSADYLNIKDITGIYGPETINHWYNIINDFCQNFIEKYQTKEKLSGIIEIEYGIYFPLKYERKRDLIR